MRINDRSPKEKDTDTVKLLLREAKQLHRAATSNSRMKALPVLRRLITLQVLRDLALTELFKNRAMVQRKHMLNLLAAEAGFCSWASYKLAICSAPADSLQHSRVVLRNAGYPNLWFSSLTEAEHYAVTHGGEPLAVGDQAVIIIDK